MKFAQGSKQPCSRWVGFENKIYLKILFSRTARMLEMWYVHFLVVLYHVCLNGGLRVQNGPA